MGSPRMTNDQLDHIVVLRESGLSCTKAAEILGVHEATVRNTWAIYEAIKDGKPLPKNAGNYRATVSWASEKLGKPPVEEMNTTQKQDNTALAFASLLDAIKALTTAVDAIDMRLSAMQMTIAGARSDAAENAKKIVEAVNVNGDIQTKEWQAIKEKLDAIKTNTKTMTRKGYES